MTSTADRIAEASKKNAELVRGLGESDSAPSSLAQQESYIKDLNHKVRTTKVDIARAETHVSKELHDHEKYRNSIFRRFAHKASGRSEQFAEKADKEEREYFDAIQQKKEAEDRLAYLEALLPEAEAVRQELQPQAERHEALQKKLDALYSSIFAGATPEFPKEDVKENALAAAKAHFNEMQTALSSEQQVVKILVQATKEVKQVLIDMDDAHAMSGYDMWGGGMMADMAKQNSLERSSCGVSKVRMLLNQAENLSQEVNHIEAMEIPQMSVWGDVVFDNIFSDSAMYDRITEAKGKLQKSDKRIQAWLGKAKQNVEKIEKDAQAARDNLNTTRQELQRVREEVFKMVGNGGAPPAYSS